MLSRQRQLRTGMLAPSCPSGHSTYQPELPSKRGAPRSHIVSSFPELMRLAGPAGRGQPCLGGTAKGSSPLPRRSHHRRRARHLRTAIPQTQTGEGAWGWPLTPSYLGERPLRGGGGGGEAEGLQRRSAQRPALLAPPTQDGPPRPPHSDTPLEACPAVRLRPQTRPLR